MKFKDLLNISSEETKYLVETSNKVEMKITKVNAPEWIREREVLLIENYLWLDDLHGDYPVISLKLS